ncbi:MAG: D-Ala-D-Ala carboxypeptidase family metallohydrolase [Cyanobacteria bacterium P01_A01_bin.116]
MRQDQQPNQQFKQPLNQPQTFKPRNKTWLTRASGLREPAFRRWRVLSTFLTGFAIGLFYVFLISGWILSPVLGETGQIALVLIFSGILGGVIYTILVDGHVEMPRFVDNGNQFEAGLFGDILLGIAGAIVLAYLAENFNVVFENKVELAAAGLVGGYGGRAILQFALNRVFKDMAVLEVDREKALKGAYQRRLERLDSLQLMEEISQYLQAGVSAAEQDELCGQIRQAPASMKKQIFKTAKETRRTATLAGETERIERTIPIFQALIAGDAQQHAYYAQLAYAYKDLASPDWLQALQQLDRAIELRGERHQAQTWKYEMSRAIVQIERSHQATNRYDFETQITDQIVQDLLTVANIYNLENLLRAARNNSIPVPILSWFQHNQAELIAREDTTDLALKLVTLLDEEHSLTANTREIDAELAGSSDKRDGLVIRAAANAASLDHAGSPLADTTAHKLDRKLFFDSYRSAFGQRLTQEKVSSLDAVLDYWDQSPHTDLRWLAYALATAHHETGSLMTPVREGFAKSDAAAIKTVEVLYARGRIDWNYAKPEANGQSYFGRGLVQITHKENYLKLGKAIGIGTELYDNPSLALDKDISVKVLFKGMVDGLYRPVHKLSKYFNPGNEDWYGARAIINGDKSYRQASGVTIGQMIANYGRQFYKCCKAAAIAPTQKPEAEGAQQRTPQQPSGDWMEAVRETWLTRSPDPVELLSAEYKKHCSLGTRYAVDSYKKDRNEHYLVTLAQGAGDWYILDSDRENHWDTTWENDHGEAKESGSTEAEGRLEQTRIEVINKVPVGEKLTPNMPFDTLITQHIAYGELAKYQEARRFVHAHQCKTAYELCVFLEKCRKHFGNHPLVITSGYRPRLINAAVKGARDSEHLYDVPSKGAIDFYIPAVNDYDLQNWCLNHYPFSVGKGAYKGFVHLGIRPARKRQAWPY